MTPDHNPTDVYIAIRASTRTGLFDLVSISDVDGSDQVIPMLDMSDVEQLSKLFWPEQAWRERLTMLRRVSPTRAEQWRAAQRMMDEA